MFVWVLSNHILDWLRSRSLFALGLDQAVHMLLSELRSGTLPLAVETGRFKSKQLSQRLCELCNSNEIEDEEFLSILLV